MVDSELDPNYLLHLSMDGPNVNLAFKDKLSKHLKDHLHKSFLNPGACLLFTPCTYCFPSGNSKYVFRSKSVFHGHSLFLQAVKCLTGRL